VGARSNRCCNRCQLDKATCEIAHKTSVNKVIASNDGSENSARAMTAILVAIEASLGGDGLVPLTLNSTAVHAMVGRVAVHVSAKNTEHLLSAERRRNTCISSIAADGAAPLSDVAVMRLKGEMTP